MLTLAVCQQTGIYLLHIFLRKEGGLPYPLLFYFFFSFVNIGHYSYTFIVLYYLNTFYMIQCPLDQHLYNVPHLLLPTYEAAKSPSAVPFCMCARISEV